MNRFRLVRTALGRYTRPTIQRVSISTWNPIRKEQNDDGTNIFKQAMEEQKRRDEAKKTQKEGNQNTQNEKEKEDVMSEEDKKNKENVGWAFGLGFLASYIYLGIFI
jgi:hypothetical protein